MIDYAWCLLDPILTPIGLRLVLDILLLSNSTLLYYIFILMTESIEHCLLFSFSYSLAFSSSIHSNCFLLLIAAWNLPLVKIDELCVLPMAEIELYVLFYDLNPLLVKS